MPRKNVNWRRLQDSTMEQAVRVLNPPRLLIADDDDDLREMLAGVLRLDGYKVLEARDGTELLQQIVATDEEDGTVDPVDLIITDVRMPGWSGLQVLSGVRRKDWAIPVMLITAYGDHDTEEEAQRLGVAAFFRKPFDLDDLRTAVANVLPYQLPAHRQPVRPSSQQPPRP
jgi:DNA-binding NtrC family response regulator